MTAEEIVKELALLESHCLSWRAEIDQVTAHLETLVGALTQISEKRREIQSHLENWITQQENEGEDWKS